MTIRAVPYLLRAPGALIAPAFVAFVLVSIVLGFATPSQADESATEAMFTGEDAHDDEWPGLGLLPARLALVIGINQYRKNNLRLAPLTNPTPDAYGIADALRFARFDVRLMVTGDPPSTEPPVGVRVAKEITKNDILNEIETFNEKVRATTAATGRSPVVLIYYAGHGVSTSDAQGRVDHFLVPSDINPIVAADVAEMSVSVGSLLQRLERAAPALRIVILDACRNDVSAMLPGGADAAKVAFDSWREDQPIVFRSPTESEKDANTNGLFLLNATTNGHTASDDGAFAKIIIAWLNMTRADARRRGYVSIKSSSNLDDLYSSVAGLMHGTAGNAQKVSNQKVAAFPLHMFPTRKDYEMERQNIIDADSLPFTAKNASPENTRAERWCRYYNIVETFTRYSYFTPKVMALWGFRDAAKMRTPYDCTQYDLGVTLDSSIKFPSDEALDLKRLAGSQGVKLKDAVPKPAIQALGGMDLERPADSLAFAVQDVDIVSWRDQKEEKVGQLKFGELVQIDASDVAGKIRVRTSSGTSGYVDALSLVAGRHPVDYVLAFPPAQVTVAAGGLGDLAVLFAQVLVMDATVTYPTGDGAVGLTRAQSVAAALTKLANSGTSGASLVPRVKPVETTADKGNVLAANQVRVAMSVLPLSAEIRQSLGQPLASSRLEVARASNIRNVVTSVDESRTLDTSGVKVLLPATETTPAQSCAAVGRSLAKSADEALSQAKRAQTNIFVQMTSTAHMNDYDTIASGMRSLGFKVPSFEIMKSPISRNQIRFCPGSDRAAAAKLATDVIHRCGYQSFDTVQLPSKICGGVKGDNVEVWLAGPS